MFLAISADKRGMTLMEVLVAMGIFVLFTVAITELLLSSFRFKDIVWEQLSTQNEGRRVVQDFVNELRTAAASSIGAYPLETAATGTIVFYSNIDADSWRERVRYFLAGDILKKGVIKPTGSPLAYNPADETVTELVHDIANATSSLFYYYDQNYTGAADTPMTYPINIPAVRVIGIKLILEENPRLSPAPLYIEAKTAIRNLKSN